MRINQESRTTLEKLHLISGKTIENVREHFESFMTLIILDYLEKGNTYIPFFGEMKINYLGDKIIRNRKQATIKLEFTPSDILLKNIGQIADGDICDIQVLLNKKIRYSLEKCLEK